MVLRVSDAMWLFYKISRTRCHPAGEAVEILWDAVPQINYVKGKPLHPLIQRLWNKEKEVA